MLKLPIGYDNFGELIKRKFNFVDKTLLIKELLDDETNQVTLITRPRRFGKTLNLSMLQYFFAKEVLGTLTQGFFDNCKIATVDGGKYMEQQGKYPVIFITFKDVKDHRYAHAYASLAELIRKIYVEHSLLLEGDNLNDSEKKFYNAILDKTADEETIKSSLLNLCDYLYRYHGSKPWLLIDEYDTPIQSAYVHGYYDEMVSVIRGLFGMALKTNPYLHRAVLTGILRIAKESLFSELNNLRVYSILDDEYSTYFGFTEEEVQGLLQKLQLEDKSSAIKKWYNGYQFGNTIVYNPWSIANCINKNGKLQPYWVNTSDNKLIQKLIVKSSDAFKSKLEDLLAEKPIECAINEDMVFGDLNGSSELAVWSLFLLSGYLKVVNQNISEDAELRTILDIPNYEVRSLYRRIIKNWLTDEKDDAFYNEILQALLAGDIEKFSEYFGLFIEQTTSYHDYANDPEAFYHGLLIGLTASLYGNKNYIITSNRESGFGRYDYLIFSQDLTKPTIIFELKRVKKPKENISEEELENLLKQTATSAINQIIAQNYLAEAKKLGATNIIKIGLAFCGKKFALINES